MFLMILVHIFSMAWTRSTIVVWCPQVMWWAITRTCSISATRTCWVCNLTRTRACTVSYFTRARATWTSFSWAYITRARALSTSFSSWTASIRITYSLLAPSGKDKLPNYMSPCNMNIYSTRCLPPHNHVRMCTHLLYTYPMSEIQYLYYQNHYTRYIYY